MICHGTRQIVYSIAASLHDQWLYKHTVHVVSHFQVLTEGTLARVRNLWIRAFWVSMIRAFIEWQVKDSIVSWAGIRGLVLHRKLLDGKYISDHFADSKLAIHYSKGLGLVSSQCMGMWAMWGAKGGGRGWPESVESCHYFPVLKVQGWQGIIYWGCGCSLGFL